MKHSPLLAPETSLPPIRRSTQDLTGSRPELIQQYLSAYAQNASGHFRSTICWRWAAKIPTMLPNPSTWHILPSTAVAR